jgi:hypothetical protein
VSDFCYDRWCRVEGEGTGARPACVATPVAAPFTVTTPLVLAVRGEECWVWDSIEKNEEGESEVSMEKRNRERESEGREEE